MNIELLEDSFISMVFNDKRFHNRTWCFFHPYEGKGLSYHITIADKDTGFGTVIPLSKKALLILKKSDMIEVYQRVLDGVLLAIEKYPEQGKPVDYTAHPMRAGGKDSRFNRTVKNDKVNVDIYNWSSIIT